MKVNVCDVCLLTEKKLTEAKWKLKKTGKMDFQKITVDLCDNHKHFLDGKSYSEILDILVKK